MLLATNTKRAITNLVFLAVSYAISPLAIASSKLEAPPVAIGSDLIGIATESRAGDVPENVRGNVVDEAGQPLAGASVRLAPFTDIEKQGTTAADGTFEIPMNFEGIANVAILVHSSNGQKVGVGTLGVRVPRSEAQKPVRIVAKRPREVAIHVANAKGEPVADAPVQAAGGHAVAESTTDLQGNARLLIPADSTIVWIVAQKKGQGFDYAEFGDLNRVNRTRDEGVPVAELPASVELRLDAIRTVSIQTKDKNGKPLEGVKLYAWLVKKEGKQTQVNFYSRLFIATSDANGTATFDWLPTNQQFLPIFPLSREFAHRRILVEPDQVDVKARLARTETLKGRVTLPDGAPAPDIEVVASGTGVENDNTYERTRTAADGTYSMRLGPDEMYAISVHDTEWTARSRLDVVIQTGHPVDAVDFQLIKGTTIRGKITIGPAELPAARRFIRLTEEGGKLPKDLARDSVQRRVQRSVSGQTDAQGDYAVRVGPGSYTIFGPQQILGPQQKEPQKLSVTDQKEIVIDFRKLPEDKGSVTGRVSGPDGKPIKGASVEIFPASMQAFPFHVKADDQGRFSAERPLVRLYLSAKSPDGSLGEVVEIEAGDSETIIVLSPTASATGILLDNEGKVAAKKTLKCGILVSLNEEKSIFQYGHGPSVVTDEKGRFTLPSLLVGQKYSLFLGNGNQERNVNTFKVKAPGQIDLGTVRAH